MAGLSCQVLPHMGCVTTIVPNVTLNKCKAETKAIDHVNSRECARSAWGSLCSWTGSRTPQRWCQQERALPSLATILATPEGRPAPLVEGALDVVAALLRPAAPDQATRVHAALSGHVMALALRADDPGVLQSCSEYLRWRSLSPFRGTPDAPALQCASTCLVNLRLAYRVTLLCAPVNWATAQG